MREPCDICGDPSDITDGIVGAYLCDKESCFHVAWDRAFGSGDSDG